MIIWLVSLLCLFLGCRFFEKQTERTFGVDIHHHVTMSKDIEYNPLPSRYLQLAQLGLIFGTESCLGIVMGLMYGPLMMIWCVVGTTFFGAGLIYYSGMYTLSTGKTLNAVLLKFFGRRIYYVLTGILMLLICLDICSNFVFLFNLNYEAFGSSQWFVVILAVSIVGLLSPRHFIKMSMATAILILITTVYFLVCSWQQLRTLPMNFHPWSLSEMKFAYPLLFFTLTSGAVSGLSALKSSLVAPYIKNEKMGIGIFLRTAFIQSGIVILWNLLILSWNPTHEFIVAVVYGGANIYQAMGHNVADYIFGGRYLFYLTLMFIGLTSIAGLLRVGVEVVLGTREYPPVALFSIEGGVLVLCAIVYPIMLNYSFAAMNLLIISICMLLLVGAYFKSKNKSLPRYFMMALFLSGVLTSEFALRTYQVSLTYSVLAGILVPLIVYLLVWRSDVSRLQARVGYWYKRQKVLKRQKASAQVLEAEEKKRQEMINAQEMARIRAAEEADRKIAEAEKKAQARDLAQAAAQAVFEQKLQERKQQQEAKAQQQEKAKKESSSVITEIALNSESVNSEPQTTAENQTQPKKKRKRHKKSAKTATPSSQTN